MREGSPCCKKAICEYLRKMKPEVRIIAVEPAASPVLSEGRAGKHGIQGIGAGFIPSILNTSVYDEIIAVTDQDAVTTAQMIGRKEGILVGISSGAAAYAAIKAAGRPENSGKLIVVIFPDGGDRYLSAGLFDE